MNTTSSSSDADASAPDAVSGTAPQSSLSAPEPAPKPDYPDGGFGDDFSSGNRPSRGGYLPLFRDTK